MTTGSFLSLPATGQTRRTGSTAGSQGPTISDDTSDQWPVPAIHITRLPQTRIEARMWVTTSYNKEVFCLSH